MKTKHLFFATALVAAFTACTNEDIVDMQQNVSTEGRPTVENVKLNFVTEGVDSRLTFGGNGYAWEATDTIGALNMDTPLFPDKEEPTWIESYKLVNYVNTSYPFTYDEAAGTWGCPGKMLEGNYFFAFPWSSFDGSRKVNYSFENQEQNGIKGAVVAENYAKNQLFIGYAQIMGGSEFDILNDIEMTSVLGAIQLRIKNEGETNLYLNKLILRHDDLENNLTFDPTNAKYGKTTGSEYSYNAGTADDPVYWFNYANYVGDEDATIYSVDEEETDKDKIYSRVKAIREVIEYGDSKGFIQLTINGTKEERTLAPGATAYALIMVNPINAGSNSLSLDIYTDGGLLQIDDLVGEADETTMKINPETSNTIALEVDAKNLKAADDGIMPIYSEEDLMQFITWNAGTAKAKTITAQLAANVELNNEMFELLKSNGKLTLKIESTSTEKTQVLTLAEDLPANVLDYEGLEILSATSQTHIATPVEVAGNLEITDETQTILSLKVLKGASVKIAANKAVVPASIVNEGTLTVGKGIKVSSASVSISNEDNAKMVVEESADLSVAVTNKAAEDEDVDEDAVIDIYGYVSNVTNNGVVNMMGAGAKFAGSSNNSGIIYTIANSEVAGTNNAGGEIVYVTDAEITATISSGSYVSYVISTATTVDKDSYKDQKINKLNVKNAVLTVNDAVTRFVVVDLYDKATLTVNEEKSLTANIVVKGAKKDEAANTAFVKGEGTVTGSVTVEENAKLVNTGNIYADGETAAFVNNGIVENTGLVQVLHDSHVAGLKTANWYYVDPVSKNNAAAVKKAELKAALIEFIDNSGRYNDNGEVDKTAFYGWAVEANGTSEGLYPGVKTYFANNDETATTQTEIDAALTAIASDKASDLKTALKAATTTITLAADATDYQAVGTAGATGYKSAQTNAYDKFRTIVVAQTNIASTATTAVEGKLKASLALGGSALSNDDITEILKAHKLQCAYIWEDCKLEEVIGIWKTYSASLFSVTNNNYSDAKTSSDGASNTKAKMLVKWLTDAKAATTNGVAVEIMTAVGTYTFVELEETFGGFTDAQFTAIDSSLLSAPAAGTTGGGSTGQAEDYQ